MPCDQCVVQIRALELEGISGRLHKGCGAEVEPKDVWLILCHGFTQVAIFSHHRILIKTTELQSWKGPTGSWSVPLQALYSLNLKGKTQVYGVD